MSLETWRELARARVGIDASYLSWQSSRGLHALHDVRGEVASASTRHAPRSPARTVADPLPARRVGGGGGELPRYFFIMPTLAGSSASFTAGCAVRADRRAPATARDLFTEGYGPTRSIARQDLAEFGHLYGRSTLPATGISAPTRARGVLAATGAAARSWVSCGGTRSTRSIRRRRRLIARAWNRHSPCSHRL
jgi:hypothetical protein